MIIDMQKDFFTKEELQIQKDRLIKNINELTIFVRDNEIPVIWIRQIHKKDLSDLQKNAQPAVIENTEGAQLIDGLIVRDIDLSVKKTNYSGFFKTNLDDLLESLNVDTLIVGGINTHACVRTTVIDAYQRNWDIIVAKDCVASWDKEHQDVTMRYFEPKIAKVLTNEEIIEGFTE